MTTTPTPTTPTPTPAAASRWTPAAVVGLLALVAGWVLRLWYEVDPVAAKAMSPDILAATLLEAQRAVRVGDGLMLLGGGLLGYSPSLPAIKGLGRGGTGLGIGLLLGMTALFAGCTHTGTRAWVEIADHPDKPRPACTMVMRLDGDPVGPKVTADRCAAPNTK